jgi:hypothetical protein
MPWLRWSAASFSLQTATFDPRVVHAATATEEVAMDKVFLATLRFSKLTLYQCTVFRLITHCHYRNHKLQLYQLILNKNGKSEKKKLLEEEEDIAQDGQMKYNEP